MTRRIGRHEAVLPVGDDALQTADRRLVHAAREVGDDGLAIGGVENRKPRLVAEHRRFLAQEADAERVESRDGDALGLFAEHVRDAFLHLARRLVGEGDRGDVGRVEAALLDQVGDLLGDHAGLARARPRQHQQGAVEVMDGFALGGVEEHEQTRGNSRRGGAGPRGRTSARAAADVGKEGFYSLRRTRLPIE